MLSSLDSKTKGIHPFQTPCFRQFSSKSALNALVQLNGRRIDLPGFIVTLNAIIDPLWSKIPILAHGSRLYLERIIGSCQILITDFRYVHFSGVNESLNPFHRHGEVIGRFLPRHNKPLGIGCGLTAIKRFYHARGHYPGY